MKLKYFTLAEFDSPDKPGSGSNMQDSTLLMLDKARGYSGIPYKINSGYRTKAHNKKVGGKPGSAHPKGYAVDIAANQSTTRLKVIQGLLKAGFTRIGIGKGFIHADNDPSMPQDVLFHYY